MFPIPQWNRTAGIFSCRRQLLPLPQWNRTAGIFSRRQQLIPLPQWNWTAGIFSRRRQLPPLLQWNRTAGIFPRLRQLSPLSQSTRRTGSLLTSSQTQILNRKAGIFFPSSPTVPSPANNSYIPPSLFVPESSLDSVQSKAEELHTPPAFRGQFSIRVDWLNFDNETYYGAGSKRSRLDTGNLYQQFTWLRDDAWHRMGETFYKCQLLSGEIWFFEHSIPECFRRHILPNTWVKNFKNFSFLIYFCFISNCMIYLLIKFAWFIN